MTSTRLSCSICMAAILQPFALAGSGFRSLDFGYDEGFPSTPDGNRMRRLTYPNSTIAANSWRAGLLQEDGTSFEASDGFALGAVNPTVHFPVASVVASITGGVVSSSMSPGGVDDPAPDGATGLYPTHGEQALYVPSDEVRIDFSTPVSAFGCFLVDVPEDSGFVLEWENANGGGLLGFPGPAPEANGSVIYLGAVFLNPSDAVTSVTIRVSFPIDGFALDFLEVHTGFAPCPGDFNGNRLIDSVDLGRLLGAWGPRFGPEDIDADGQVDSDDLADLLASWGPCVPIAVEAQRSRR